MAHDTLEALKVIVPFCLLLLSPFLFLYGFTQFLGMRRRWLFARLQHECGDHSRGSAVGGARSGFAAFFASAGSVRVTNCCESQSHGSRIAVGDIAFKQVSVPGLAAMGTNVATATAGALVGGAAGGVAAVATSLAEHRTSFASMKAAKPLVTQVVLIRPRQTLLGVWRKTGALGQRYQIEQDKNASSLSLEELLPTRVRELLAGSTKAWEIQLKGNEAILFPAIRLGFVRERHLRFMFSVVREWASELN